MKSVWTNFSDNSTTTTCKNKAIRKIANNTLPRVLQCTTLHLSQTGRKRRCPKSCYGAMLQRTTRQAQACSTQTHGQPSNNLKQIIYPLRRRIKAKSDQPSTADVCSRWSDTQSRCKTLTKIKKYLSLEAKIETMVLFQAPMMTSLTEMTHSQLHRLCSRSSSRFCEAKTQTQTYREKKICNNKRTKHRTLWRFSNRSHPQVLLQALPKRMRALI